MVTNLDAIKKEALILLRLPIKQNENIPVLVSHPYFDTVCCQSGKELINIIENEEKAKDTIRYLINNVTDCMQFLVLVRKPYLPVFFKMICNHLSEEDYAKFLSEIWIIVEYPNADANVSLKEWLSYFKRANKNILMEEKDYNRYLGLPEQITIYRGVKPQGKVKALSWSLSYDTAKWFADRFESNGVVYKAQISKENVLAYFNNRNEQEIVADYTKLRNIEIC